MNRGQKDEENRRSIQVVILACYMFFSIGLIVANINRGWELWTVPILVIGLFISFSLYATQKFEYRYRIYIYAGFISLSIFFYGTHIEALSYTALVVVIAMLLFALTEEKAALRIFLMTYILLICYHAGLIIFKFEELTLLTNSSMLLSICAVFLAGQIAGYVCEMLAVSRKAADELEVELGNMKRRSEDFMANVSHELRTPINVVTGLTSILLEDEKEARRKADLQAIQGAGRRLFGRIEDILDYTEIDTDSLKLTNSEYRISSIINDIATEYRLGMRKDTPELIIDMDCNIPARMDGDALRIKRVIKHLVTNAIKFTDVDGCIYLKVFTRKKDYGVNLCIEVTDTGIGMSEEEIVRVTTAAGQADSGRNRRAEGIGLGLAIVFGFVKKMGGFLNFQSEPKKGTKVTVSIPQKVIDDKPSVGIDHPENMRIVCYLNISKFNNPAIREYYMRMLTSSVNSLNLSCHIVTTEEDLKNLINSAQVTHICIAETEYLADKSYYESLTKDHDVVVAVSGDYKIPRSSKVTYVRKPLFSHGIASAINRMMSVWEFDPETSGKKLVFEGVKALVVDDEEMNLIVAKGILSGYGMNITLVRSGREAIKECEQNRFDVIFMDHMMPEMDGVEAMKTIKLNYGSDDHTAMIAFSANAVSGVRDMFMREGFDEFISKPIDTAELERVLKKLLPSTMWQYKQIEDDREQIDEEYDESYSNVDKFSVLNAIEGIRHCRGSEALYEEVLKEFRTESDELISEMQNILESKDWENYYIKLNAIKLSARLIGAEDLAKESQALEKAASQSWEAYIIANHDSVIHRILAVTEDINRVYGGAVS